MRDGKQNRIGQKAATGGRFLPQGPRRRKHEKTSKSAPKPQRLAGFRPKARTWTGSGSRSPYKRNILIGRSFARLDAATCVGI
jgi:hypothetical protein